MAVGLIVGVLLISGVVAPVISDTVSTDNAEVVNDFSTYLSNEGLSSDYYRSAQMFYKDHTPSPPTKDWSASDFTHLSSHDNESFAELYSARGEESTVEISYYNMYYDGSTQVYLEEPTFLYDDSSIDTVPLSDLENFTIHQNGYDVSVSYTFEGEDRTYEMSAYEISYLSSDYNGWCCPSTGDKEGFHAQNGVYMMIGFYIFINGSGLGWIDYDTAIEFDESMIEGDAYKYSLDVVVNGTDYGTYDIDIGPVTALGDGKYVIGNEGWLNDGEYTSTDGTHTLILSEDSWLRAYSIMAMDPYVSYTPSEPISSTLVSLITVVPLLLTVGLVMAVVMSIKKD